MGRQCWPGTVGPHFRVNFDNKIGSQLMSQARDYSAEKKNSPLKDRAINSLKRVN
jgi:hypothetical protein